MTVTQPARPTARSATLRTEVRQEMHTILGFAELLSEEARLPPRLRKFAAYIHAAAGRLYHRLLAELTPDRGADPNEED